MTKGWGLIGLILALLTLTFSPESLAADAPGASGHWEGNIATPDMPLGIVVDLSKDSMSHWAGRIGIPAQRLKDFVLSNISVQGTDVSFEMQGVPGNPAFKGKLSEDGKSISGSFTQGGGTFPFKLEKKGEARAAEPKKGDPTPAKGLPGEGLDGIWQGTLVVGPTELRLVLKITKATDGTFSGKMDSLDQEASDLPVSSITLKETRVEFEMRTIQGSYDGKLNQDKSEITGEWTQSGQKMPLVFRRTKKAG